MKSSISTNCGDMPCQSIFIFFVPMTWLTPFDLRDLQWKKSWSEIPIPTSKLRLAEVISWRVSERPDSEPCFSRLYEYSVAAKHKSTKPIKSSQDRKPWKNSQWFLVSFHFSGGSLAFQRLV